MKTIGNLETEVSEGAVGLGHLVNVVTLTNRAALVVGGILDFVGEGDVHWSSFTTAGITDDPAKGERLGASRLNFKWHLVSRTTNAAAFDFHARLGVLNGASNDFERIDGVDSFVGLLDGGVNDALREGTLAVVHDLTDQVTDERAVVA